MTNKHNMRYIVVHSTATTVSQVLNPNLPYHFLITPAGRLIKIRPIKAEEGCVDIAYQGGLDKKGSLNDSRTTRQCDCMFTTLLLLSEQFPDARIVGADDLYGSNESPGFSVKNWLNEYLPSLLLAA